MLNPSQRQLAHTFQKMIKCENWKPLGEGYIADQGATEEFLKYLLSVIQEKGYVRVLF